MLYYIQSSGERLKVSHFRFGFAVCRNRKGETIYVYPECLIRC